MKNRPIISRQKLELFRDLMISPSELSESGKIDLWNAQPECGGRVEVCKEHVANVLNSYLRGRIDQEFLLNWLNYVWLLPGYEFCDEYHDSIIGVITNVELIKMGAKLTEADFQRYLKALDDNVELPLELDHIIRG